MTSTIVSADPRAFRLNGIGLHPVWKAALSGKLVSYGRRPWLSLRLPSLIPAVCPTVGWPRRTRRW